MGVLLVRRVRAPFGGRVVRSHLRPARANLRVTWDVDHARALARAVSAPDGRSISRNDIHASFL